MIKNNNLFRLFFFFLVFFSSHILAVNSNQALAQEFRSGAEVLNVEMSNAYPWEISEGVKFAYKFSTLPKPGTNAVLDVDFLAADPNLQKATTSVNTYNRVVESGIREGFVYYFNSPVTIENIYTTLDLTFYCESKKSAAANTTSVSIHRLVKPFTSYEYKTPGARTFETFNRDIHLIKPEQLVLDNQKQVSVSIPSDCLKLYLQRSLLTIWVDYTNPWFVSFNGQRYSVPNPSSRLSVSSSSNVNGSVLLMNFGPASSSAPSSKVKSTPTPTKSPTKPVVTKVVKEGASCTPAGKITQASKINLVCAKVGTKLIWVALSSSSPSKSSSPTSIATKVCNTNSNSVRSYLGSDTSEGFSLAALVFENLSDCNLSISATATFICPDGGPLKPTNALQSTGSFALAPKQKLLITGPYVNRYFPLVTQQCFQLTGVKTNNPSIDTYYRGPLRATVLTSTP